MIFKESFKNKVKPKLQLGDFFKTEKSDSVFYVVRPLVRRLGDDFKNEGYTFVNMTFNSLVSKDRVFDTLEELQRNLEKIEGELTIFKGEEVFVNLGKPK